MPSWNTAGVLGQIEGNLKKLERKSQAGMGPRKYGIVSRPPAMGLGFPRKATS
jgi:hypothetical protein